MVFERLAARVKNLRILKVTLPQKPAALEEWEKKVPHASPTAPQTAPANPQVSFAVPTVSSAAAIAPVAKNPSIPAAAQPKAFREFGATA